MTDESGRITIKAANDSIASLFGKLDRNIIKIEKAFGVTVVNRGEDILIVGGSGAAKAESAVNRLLTLAERGDEIDDQTINYLVASLEDDTARETEDLSGDTVCLTVSGKPIKPKTAGQKKYINSIRKNTIVFGVGPAGTGKTYLAMSLAITAFKRNDAQRIILTRPAIEAGEKLGFLPGDLQQKVDPYLRPLYDALYEIMGADNYTRNVEKGSIEVAPLAYMRGRTLDNSFIVLDEAQNTTPEQMKMFLTRIGFNSKVVITGDITQIDLPDGKKSGLIEAISILNNIEDIEIVYLTAKDVVRHPLVQKIIGAYEKKDAKRRASEIKRRGFTIKRRP